MRRLFQNKYQNPLSKSQWVWFLCTQGVLLLLLPDRIPTAWAFGFDVLVLPLLLAVSCGSLAVRRGLVWYLPILSTLLFFLTSSPLDWLTLTGYSLLYLVFSFLGLTIGFVIYRIKTATKAD